MQAAAITSDILEALGRDGHFTLFAPTNEAFEKLPRGVLERIMGDKVASEGRKRVPSLRSVPSFQGDTRKEGTAVPTVSALISGHKETPVPVNHENLKKQSLKEYAEQLSN